MKILVVKRDKLGDMLLSTPLFAHLRANLPQAQIHLLANDYNVWVAQGHPALDRTWVYLRAKVGRRVRPRAAIQQLGLTWRLWRERFDVAIVAQGEYSPRAIRRALWAGAKRTIAYVPRDSALRLRLSDALDPPGNGHELQRVLALAGALGLAPPRQPLAPTYTPPEEALRFARNWLAENKLAQNGYIVFGLGARRARKQSSPAQIQRWTTYVKQTYGLDTIFMWTPGGSDNPLYPGDDAVAQPVLALNLPHLHPFRGPIREALGLIWNARTNIFPDSGLMHFAAASPGGVIGLFAEQPDWVEQWAPQGPRAVVLDARESVAELTDGQVYRAVASLIQTRAAEL